MLTGILPGKGAGSVTEDSSGAVWLQQARSYLRNADPVLARLIDDRPDLRSPGVDGPAADGPVWCPAVPGHRPAAFRSSDRRTLARIQALFDGHLPSPTELLGVDPGKLREAGLGGGRSAHSVTSPRGCRTGG